MPRTEQRRHGQLTIDDERRITEALVRNGYVLKRTAEDLGMHPNTLTYRLVRLGIYDQVRRINRHINPPPRPKLGNMRTEYLLDCVSEVYKQHGGNLTRTAEYLGVTEHTVRGWLKHRNRTFGLHEHSYLWWKERELILATLDKHDGNRRYTAIELGLSERRLRSRLLRYRELGIENELPENFNAT